MANLGIGIKEIEDWKTANKKLKIIVKQLDFNAKILKAISQILGVRK